jgi:hypothetical protein
MSIAQAQTVLERIRTRGYWRAVIRPTTFADHHISSDADLFRIVERASVQLRGWPYPYSDRRKPLIQSMDSVGQETEWQDEIEVWRLYMSGQFVHFFAIAGEWRDHSSIWSAEPDWQPGKYLYYQQTIYSMAEVFEFASRLALSPASAPSMRVEIDLVGLEGRQIIERDARFQFSRTYETQIPSWKHCWEGLQTELIARPRELSAMASRELFARFGLDVTLEMLSRLQAGIDR